jgi:hypothetical protein
MQGRKGFLEELNTYMGYNISGATIRIGGITSTGASALSCEI